MIRAKRAVAAARALYREGLLSESHASLVKAFDALLEAWRPEPAAVVPTDGEGDAAEPAPEPADVAEPIVADAEEQALAAIEKAGYRRMARLRQARTTARELGTEPVTSLGRVEWIWAEIERLTRFSQRQFLTPAAAKRLRIRRIALAGTALVILAVVIGILWARPRIAASATFSTEHPAYHVYDGVDSTEWLLPEASAGWVELRLRSSRTIKTVRLVNCHNRYYMDRAAEKVRVTAYAGGKQVGTAEGKFKGIVEKRSTLDLNIKASGVTRVRVEIQSWFGRGGGLSEIELR